MAWLLGEEPMLAPGSAVVLVASILAELKKHGAAMNDVMLTSAHAGTGLEDLRAVITGYTVS